MTTATNGLLKRKWPLWLVWVLALCLLAGLSWFVYDHLTFQPSGEIAYECHRNGTSYTDICAIDADGLNQRVLIQFDQQSAVSPAWSFDGKKLAFISNSSVYISKGDGTNITHLISDVIDGRVLNWASNKYELLVWLNILEKEGLYSVNADGYDLSPKFITSKFLGATFPVIWHPNGNEILASVKVSDSSSSGHEIVRFVSPDFAMKKTGFSCSEMTINPEGNIFVCREDKRLILRDISTGEHQAITNWSMLLSGNRTPAWSPDSLYIVYSQTHWPTFLDGRSGELWIMNADGSHPVKLTNGPNDRNPTWRPEP